MGKNASPCKENRRQGEVDARADVEVEDVGHATLGVAAINNHDSASRFGEIRMRSGSRRVQHAAEQPTISVCGMLGSSRHTRDLFVHRCTQHALKAPDEESHTAF